MFKGQSKKEDEKLVSDVQFSLFPNAIILYINHYWVTF